MKLDKITVPIALVISSIIGAFIFAAWYFGNLNAQAQTISDIKTKFEVHETKIQNLTENLTSEDSRMTRLEVKIDALLTRQGLDPSRYNKTQ